MKLSTISFAALTVALAAAPAFAKKVAPDPTRMALADLHVAANCDDAKSPLRPWCIAADGWATGTAGKLPMGKVLLGITIERRTGTPGPWDLLNDGTIRLVALVVRHDGAANELRLIDITPSNDSEKAAIATTIGNLAAQFKGKGGTVKVSKDLATYLKGELKKSGHFATKGAAGWTWPADADGELRKVGKFWVAIETPKTGPEGRFITILTDKWK